jgi:hypothetical protein
MSINYTPPPTGKAFMLDEDFFRVIMGPIGSGKSCTCVMEILRRCIDMPKSPDGLRHSRWCVVRNTNKQLKDTTLKTFREWIPAGTLGIWKESDMTFQLRFNDVDAEILFRPLDSPEDVQRVLSLELTGAWINEAREIPIEILLALMGRLRRFPSRRSVSNYWSGIIADTNPPEIDSSWYNIIEHLPQKEDEPDSVIPCSSYKQPDGLSPEAENLENLAEGYYTKLAVGKTVEWVNVYIRGLYAMSQAGKPIYQTSFRFDRHVSRKSLIIHPSLPIICGYDFGRTPAAIFLQPQPTGRIRYLREAVGFDMGLKTHIATKLKPVITANFASNPIIFVGDPAGVRQSDSDDNSCFKELRLQFPQDKGFMVKAAATNDPIVRINALGEPLREYPDGDPLIEIDPACKWFIEGLRSKYRYMRRVGGGADLYQNAPQKNSWSHVVEAAQYGTLFINGRFRIADYEHLRPNKPFNPLNITKPYRPADSYGGY